MRARGEVFAAAEDSFRSAWGEYWKVLGALLLGVSAGLAALVHHLVGYRLGGYAPVLALLVTFVLFFPSQRLLASRAAWFAGPLRRGALRSTLRAEASAAGWFVDPGSAPAWMAASSVAPASLAAYLELSLSSSERELFAGLADEFDGSVDELCGAVRSL